MSQFMPSFTLQSKLEFMPQTSLPSKDLAFKVLRNHGANGPLGPYTSAVANGTAALSYMVDEWTQARPQLVELGYGIAVFATYHAAKGFYQDMIDPAVVFLVEVEGIINKPAERYKSLSALGIFLQKICEPKGSNAFSALHFARWPEDTVLVTRIKLLERVG